MQIPTKIQHGEKVISTVFEKINGIIDYLNASKLRKSSGIDVLETPSGTLLKLIPEKKAAPQLQPAAPVSGSCIPDYSNPTSISANTQYGPFAYPVWLIGSIGALLYGSNIYEAYLTLGSTSTNIDLFDVAQTNGLDGYQITQLIVPVSILIPASTTFEVHTQTIEPLNFYIKLNYYPCI